MRHRNLCDHHGLAHAYGLLRFSYREMILPTDSQLSLTSSFSYSEYNSLKNITFEAKKVLMAYLIKDAVFKSVKICSFVLHLECLKYAFETCVETFPISTKDNHIRINKIKFACFSLKNSGL